jgi:hypothetical protein
MGTNSAGGYQYGYTNDLPGGSDTFLPIHSATETTHQLENPATDSRSAGMFDPVSPAAPQNIHDPVAKLNERIQETDLRGVGLGDYVANANYPSALANPSR